MEIGCRPGGAKAGNTRCRRQVPGHCRHAGARGHTSTAGLAGRSADCGASANELRTPLLLDSGVLGSNVVREVQRFFKTIEKEGLQGGKGD